MGIKYSINIEWKRISGDSERTEVAKRRSSVDRVLSPNQAIEK